MIELSDKDDKLHQYVPAWVGINPFRIIVQVLNLSTFMFLNLLINHYVNFCYRNCDKKIQLSITLTNNARLNRTQFDRAAGDMVHRSKSHL